MLLPAYCRSRKLHIAGSERQTNRLAVAFAERQLRKSLEAEFGEDLSNRKTVVREEVHNAPLPPSTCRNTSALKAILIVALSHSPLAMPPSLQTERAFCSPDHFFSLEVIPNCIGNVGACFASALSNAVQRG